MASIGLKFESQEGGATVVGKGACTDKQIVIPALCEYGWVIGIRKEAFRGDSTIVNVKIPDSVTHIEDGAFYGCTSLKSAEIMSYGPLFVGAKAFYGCGKLAEIFFSGTV